MDYYRLRIGSIIRETPQRFEKPAEFVKLRSSKFAPAEQEQHIKISQSLRGMRANFAIPMHEAVSESLSKAMLELCWRPLGNDSKEIEYQNPWREHND